MSSSGNSTCSNCSELGYCEAISRGAFDINNPNNPTTSRTPAGVIDALLSDSNTENSRYMIQPDGEANVRKLRIKRLQRATIDDVTDAITCDTIGDVSQYTEETICPAFEVQYEFSVTQQELQAYCSDATQVLNFGMAPTPLYVEMVRKINAGMNAIKQRKNQILAAKLLANVGTNPAYGNSTPQTLNFLNATSGGKIEDGIGRLIQDFRFAEKNGRPILIGSGVMERMLYSLGFSCCNSEGFSWADFQASQPVEAYLDYQMPNLASNNNYFMVLAPGTTQYISYLDYPLFSRFDGGRVGDKYHGMIIDPSVENGQLKYDMKIEVDDCVNSTPGVVWNIKLYSHFDVVLEPANSYSATDRLVGDNGIYNYIAAVV